MGYVMATTMTMEITTSTVAKETRRGGVVLGFFLWVLPMVWLLLKGRSLSEGVERVCMYFNYIAIEVYHRAVGV